MAVDNFIYQGINRAVSDFTGARVCEELINLRPTEGGVVPVRDFTPKFSNQAWDKVFSHYTTSGPKYIVVRHTSSAVQVGYLPDPDAPTTITSLFSVNDLSDVQDVLDHLYFAAASNIVLFSVCAPSAGKYENHAFTWKYDGDSQTQGYVQMDADVPEVGMQITERTNPDAGGGSQLFMASQGILDLDKGSSVNECTEAVQSGLNAIQEENPDLCLGPVVIAVAYRTTDGKTFWTGNWTAYDPIKTIRTDSQSTYCDATTMTDPMFAPFFDKYGAGYQAGAAYASGRLSSVFAYGTKVRLEFARLDTTHPSYPNYWNKDTSIIRSVEVYCSRPALYLNANGAKDGLFEEISGQPQNNYLLILPQVKIEDMDLGGQLLYHQASIPMESLAGSNQTVNLSFGGNAQLGEDTLDTDAGALNRYGRLLSYNARFHYYDSVSKIEVGMPYFSWSGTGGSATVDVFVRYADEDQSELLYLGSVSGYKDNAPIVIAPSINIKEVITANQYDSTHVDVKSYRMEASSSYNYAINTDGPTLSRISPAQFQESDYYAAKQAGVNAILSNTETDAINVTEQYNPFVFRVEHSYKAPGNSIDVQPQMAGIVDASYGRDPLNVFTERGLYALTQGSANVLYGAFLPLSNLKASRGGIPVEMGTFFLADGGLWLVSGRRVALVSEALSLGPHKYLRACTGYRKLSGTDTGFSIDGDPVTPVPNPVYDVSPYLSKVDFKTFTADGRLSYNRHRMEILISNPAYSYTYALSLKNYQWHKISKRLWQDEPGSTVVNTPGTATGTITVLDMAEERSFHNVPSLIHLQSRPFSMGYQYSHVHRVVAMMRAMLPNAYAILTTALYGSDDLQHWTLLSYGKWSGRTDYDEQREALYDTPLFLSQMRIPSAARSWRYYTVCIGGTIPTDHSFPTDIGPVLVDYEPVTRRIG